MPTLAKVNGVKITMYFDDQEHDPPHIHAYYGKYGVSINLKNFEITGKLPKKKLISVVNWAKEHKSELLEMWENQEFKKIE